MEVTLANVLLLMVFVLAILAGALAFLGSKIKEKWDATSMYNVAACLVVASIIACALSFLAVWVALPNSKDVDYTHQDVVVDILGVLVTVLMGWNIISVVDIKKKAENVESVASDLEKVISSIIQMSIHSFTMRPDKEAVINSCFLALEKAHECRNEFVRKTSIKEIMRVLHQVRCSYRIGEVASIFQGHKERYLSILWGIDDEYKEEIKSMIEQAIILNTNNENIMFAVGGQHADNSNFGTSEGAYNTTLNR